jgi:hypothetical protein
VDNDDKWEKKSEYGGGKSNLFPLPTILFSPNDILQFDRLSGE